MPIFLVKFENPTFLENLFFDSEAEVGYYYYLFFVELSKRVYC